MSNTGLQDGEMGLLVKFDDESSSYVNGFEAGMIWQQMQDGVPLIEPEIPVHTANMVTFERMAKAADYTAIFEQVDDMPEWMGVIFEKTIRRLTLVPDSGI